MRWEHEPLLAPAGESPFPRALGEHVSPLDMSHKPVFSPQDAAEVIDLFADRGVAITHGRVYLKTDEGFEALEVPGQPVELLRLPGAWGCRREPGEPWDEFVARSTATAREQIERVTSLDVGGGGAAVDLEWVTEDELTYFGIPSAALATDRGRIASGERPSAIHDASLHDGTRVRWAGAARGSFYARGVPADLGDLPRDTRFLQLPDRSRIKDVVERAPKLEVLHAPLLNDDALEAIGRLRELRMLELYQARVTSVQAISGMQALEHLSVHAVGRAPDMTPLARASALKVLELSGRALDRFDDVSGCRQLVGLHVLGGGPGAGVAIESLAPVANLTRLRVLRVGLTRVRDRSLRAVANLKALRALGIESRRYPLEELAWLAANVTWLDHDVRSPFESAQASRFRLSHCKKCGQESRLATRGPRRQWLCPRCQPTKVAEYVAKWELLLATEVWLNRREQ